MAGDEQQGATTAETVAEADGPTRGQRPEQGSGQQEEHEAGQRTPRAASDADMRSDASAGSDASTGSDASSGSDASPGSDARQSAGQQADPGQGQGEGQVRPEGRPAGGPSRQRNRTVRGMILSLLVIGAAVAVIYTFFIPHDDKADPVQRVDYRVELITARRAAPYPVAAPVGLPHSWKPTSVTYDQSDGHAWHIGFLDPAGQYVAIEQATSPAKRYANDVSQNAKDTGRTQQIAGKEWQRWAGGRYDALVHTEGGATTVVTGTASYKDLATMVAALQFARTKA